MTKKLLIWILFAPLGIFFIMGLLGEILGLSDGIVGFVALVLVVAYVGGLIRVVIAMKRGMPEDIRSWLKDKNFSIDGRKAEGDWKGKPVALTYLIGAGGIPDEMKMASGDMRSSMSPVQAKELEGWLDQATG